MNVTQTLYSWLDYWREMYFRPTVSHKTYQNSYYYLQIIKKHIADCELRRVTLPFVQRLLNDLRDEGYARETIKKIYRYVYRALEMAAEQRLIENAPVGAILPKAGKKTVKALTKGEQEVLEVFCKDTLYGEYMLFLLLTGLRVGELINLQWNDYCAAERCIYIRASKTDEGIRCVPLLQRAVDIIEAQLKLDDPFIFHNKHKKPIGYSSMKKCYEKLRKKTGFTDFTNHVCRHSFATRLMEAGANPKSAAALLGHRKVDFCLNVYTDIERETMKKDIYLLEEKPQIDINVLTMDCIILLQQIRAANGGEIPDCILQVATSRHYVGK